MGWQSSHPNKNKNGQSQRYNRKRQQNWSNGSHFNSAQDGTYSYNESWQQYPNNAYQNNAYWQPVPQNIYPMSNRSYVGYRPSYNGPHLPQYGNSNNLDSPNQYYQGKLNFQSNGTQNQYPKIPFVSSRINNIF